jgi:hypothetical protein
VADYEQLLRRLVGAIERVVYLPDAYAGNGAVFEDRTVAEPPDDFASFAAYVRKMRLRTILQKAWMRALGLATLASMPGPPLRWRVDETRGAALLHTERQLGA